MNESFTEHKKLRILAVHRYYWPDTPPYAAMLRRIAARWREDGHHVEVLSSQPSYKLKLKNKQREKHEVLDGVVVRRLNLPNEIGRPIVRMINALYLSLHIFSRMLKHRFDVIMISTVPPVMGAAAAALAARLTGARFIYHCMDIHPEVGRLSGEFSNPFVFKLLSILDGWSCRHARPVIVLSKDMKRTLRQRSGGDQFLIQVLNNFSLPSDEKIPDKLPFKLEKKRLTILFAGNIGRFQNLDLIIDAMEKIKQRKDIEVIFMGEGHAKSRLQEKSEALGLNARFIGHQPVEIAKAAMQQVDFGLVSLMQGVYCCAFPSKTMTYLEQGCPIIVSVEPESDLSRDVKAEQYGFWMPIRDCRSVAELFLHLADNRSLHANMKKRAKEIFKERFSEQAILDEWSNMLRV